MPLEDPQTYFPNSPMEMASWVRDRSVRVVHELSEVITMLRHHSQISEDVQSDLHLSLSAALANALKLMSFAAGHHLTSEELSEMIGMIYEKGEEGFLEVAHTLECSDIVGEI